MANQYPPQYPPQGGPPNQYPPQYPPYGQPGQSSQYPGQYPNQPASYAQPGQPSQYPYAQQGYPGQPMVATQAPPKEENTYARQSLIYGGVSLVLVIVLAFFGYWRLGFLAIFAVIYGIIGLVRAIRLPRHTGLVASIFGILLSILSLLLTVGILILSSLPDTTQ